MLGMDNW